MNLINLVLGKLSEITLTEDNATWNSENEKVATVENGKITAVGAGETVITATVGDVAIPFTVVVKENPYNENGVYIRETHLNLEVLGIDNIAKVFSKSENKDEEEGENKNNDPEE